MSSRSTPSLDSAAVDGRPPEVVVDSGRLGVYAALGAASRSVPLPWVPDLLASRVRGALVHDIASRRGVSLSPEARTVLAEAAGGAPRGIAANALRFVGARIAFRTLSWLGPAAFLWPLGGALRTYVLGRLFDRYLERHRALHGRIEAAEAHALRRAIDAALLQALRISDDPDASPAVADDARDRVTAVVDSLLAFAAGLPSRVGRRIDAAFDEAIADAHK
jgi:hypothetical protein